VSVHLIFPTPKQVNIFTHYLIESASRHRGRAPWSTVKAREGTLVSSPRLNYHSIGTSTPQATSGHKTLSLPCLHKMYMDSQIVIMWKYRKKLSSRRQKRLYGQLLGKGYFPRIEDTDTYTKPTGRWKETKEMWKRGCQKNECAGWAVGSPRPS
jgi:hypothetical protein